MHEREKGEEGRRKEEREREREGERERGGRGGREEEKRGGKREKERERGREKRREKGPAPKVQLRSEALHTADKFFFGGCAPRPCLVVEGEGRHSTRREKCEGEIGKGEQGASDALTQTCCCLTEPLSHGTLRRITPKTAAWARDRADIFPATYTYGWVRTEHRLTHSDRLQSTPVDTGCRPADA